MKKAVLEAIAVVKSDYSMEAIRDAIGNGEELDRIFLNIREALKQEFQNRLHPYIKQCHFLGMQYARYQLDAEEEIREESLDVGNYTYALNRISELGSLLTKDVGNIKDELLQEEEDIANELEEQENDFLATLLWLTIGLNSNDAKHFMNRIEAMLEAEQDLPQMLSRIQRITGALNRQRADMIANTESNMAMNQGLVYIWTMAASSGIISASARKRWNVTWDEALCPLCEPLADTTSPLGSLVWSIGRTIVEEGVAIPRHPRCRCYYTLVI